MNFTKSLLTLAVASVVLSGCKDTASKPLPDNLKETSEVSQKTNAVVVKPQKASFKIEGMTCAMGCAKTIETKLSKMDGVQKAVVDFDKKEATINFDATVVTSEKLVETVQKTGDGATYKVVNVKVN